MSKLFSPIQIKNLALENRIVIPPMCQYSSDNGEANSWHTIHYGSLAFSGSGLLIFEATAIDPIGRISDRDLGLWDDRTEQALTSLLKNIRKYSAISLGIQLSHAGRKGSTTVPWLGDKALAAGEWQTVGPSAIKYKDDYSTPQELTIDGIQKIIKSFVDSAIRADRAGFDTVEVHSAHGYLLHQFLSPLSNQRQDQYGGSLENRMRLTLEVFKAIRAAFPANKAVGVRISATDWVNGGWDLKQSIELVKQLKTLGCDFIDVSTGGLSHEQEIPVAPNYQVSFAKEIKKAVGMPTIAVGLITEAKQAEEIISTEQADMVEVGRGTLFNPHWPWQAAVELGGEVTIPPQYLNSKPHSVKKLFK